MHGHSTRIHSAHFQYHLLLIADPTRDREAHEDFELARNLAQRGHTVTLILAHSAIKAAMTHAAAALADLVDAGVGVTVDPLSLHCLGICNEQLPRGFTPAAWDPPARIRRGTTMWL